MIRCTEQKFYVLRNCKKALWPEFQCRSTFTSTAAQQIKYLLIHDSSHIYRRSSRYSSWGKGWRYCQWWSSWWWRSTWRRHHSPRPQGRRASRGRRPRLHPRRLASQINSLLAHFLLLQVETSQTEFRLCYGLLCIAAPRHCSLQSAVLRPDSAKGPNIFCDGGSVRSLCVPRCTRLLSMSCRRAMSRPR